MNNTYNSSIKSKFSELIKQNKKAFIPYIMAGDYDLEETLKRIKILQDCGADMIELGVPFSDPLADGPTIQASAERALSKGVTLRKILSFLKLNRDEIKVPVILMTYYNPIFKIGEDAFLQEASSIGVNGLIIPDLTAEEAFSFVEKARYFNIDTIFLIAPTSTPERIKLITSLCNGFVYYVSIVGITGSELKLPTVFYNQLSLIRKATDLPISVGFGISRPSEASLIAQVADGVIVGSAIVKKFNEKSSEIKPYLKQLREAIRSS